MSAVTHDPDSPGVADKTIPAAEPPTQDHAPATPSNRLRFSPFSIVLFGVVFWVIPLLGYFFARFIDILLVVFLAVLLSTFLSPLVNGLQRLHIHRGVSILLIYLVFLGILLLVGTLATPLFVDETQRLVNQLPGEIQKVLQPLHGFGINVSFANGGLNVKNLINSFLGGGHSVAGIAGQAVGLVFTVGTVLVAVLSILVMAFFLTVQRTFTADVVNVLLPPAYRRRTTHILSRMGERMGHWVIGQIIITVYYAVAFSVGLFILHVPNALSVGVITGVLEIIPFVGGFIGVVLACLVALTVNPILVIWVIVLYLIVTNVEAHIIVPNLYGKVVNVHPVLVVVALLIGAEAFGLIGALIAVPLAAALQVVVENLYIKDVVEAAEQQPPRRRPGRPTLDLDKLRRVRTWRRG